MNGRGLGSRWLRWSSAAILAGLAVAAMARDFPMVGHDYRYFIPRLIDTALHIRANGFSIQWYTPTFGGGLPAFPNPQHLEYSAIQLLTLAVNPWIAIVLVTAIVVMVGFFAAAKLLQDQLSLDPFAATIGAVFFIANGFFFEHLIVGHLGFQLFPLAPVLLLLALDRTRAVAANTALFALTVALIVMHSGFHLIILLSLSILLALLLIESTGWRRVDLRRASITALGGILLALGIVAPKLQAVLALMRQFPRETADVYDAGLLQALAGLGAQLGLVMIATPVMWIAHLDLNRISAALMKITGAGSRMGIWELDSAVSPVLLIAVVAAMWHLAAARRSSPLTRDRRQAIATLALLIGSWIAVEITLSRGFIYPLIQRLPVMRSLHVTVRFAAVFVLPMAIAGAMTFDRWTRAGLRSSLAWLSLIVAIGGPVSYLLLPPVSSGRTFNITRSLDDDRRMRAGEPFVIERIADLDDAQALSSGASSLRVYEPLFGYALETFTPHLTFSSVDAIRDGGFNITNPASLVFPEINGLEPFDRIRTDDHESLTAFVNHRQPAWRLPPSQRVLVILSLVLTTIAVLVSAIGFLPRFSRVER